MPESKQSFGENTQVLNFVANQSTSSRRPFCPPDHWFVSGLDMATFRETAIADEFSIETEVQDARQPRRAPSKLRMARISPHLGVLNNIPFVLPFEDRVQVFRMFIRNDRKPQYAAMGVPDDMEIDNSFFPPVARVTIRRDHVFEDGFTHLYGLGENLMFSAICCIWQ
jgi:ubiquitin-protein ligase E3 C